MTGTLGDLGTSVGANMRGLLEASSRNVIVLLCLLGVTNTVMSLWIAGDHVLAILAFLAALGGLAACAISTLVPTDDDLDREETEHGAAR